MAHPGRRQHRNVQRASRRQAIVACAVRHARRVFERFRKVVSARFVVSLIGEAVLTAVWCVTSFISRGSCRCATEEVLVFWSLQFGSPPAAVPVLCMQTASRAARGV